MEKNNLSQDFFDTHFELCESKMLSWDDGASFRVGYKFILDWGVAYNNDQFKVKIYTDNNLHSSLDLPHNIYLTKEKIGINEETGNLTLAVSAQYEKEENSCIEGTIDLITGKKTVNDTPCWIN